MSASKSGSEPRAFDLLAPHADRGKQSDQAVRAKGHVRTLVARTARSVVGYGYYLAAVVTSGFCMAMCFLAPATRRLMSFLKAALSA